MPTDPVACALTEHLGEGCPTRKSSFPAGRLRWTPVGKCLAGGIPVLLFSGPVGLRGHHVCHRMRDPILHGAMWLLARAHALETVGHMLQRAVIDAHWRQLRLTRTQDILGGPLLVDFRIAHGVALLFGHLIARTAFAPCIG